MGKHVFLGLDDMHIVMHIARINITKCYLFRCVYFLVPYFSYKCSKY